MNILDDLKKWRFWRHLVFSAFACGGVLSGVIQFFLIVWPNLARSFQGAWLLGVVALISLIVGLVVSWPRPIAAEYSAPKTKIRIIKGDLLDQTEHLAIGICDTFDTEIPNIISRNSLQGQALSRLFNDDVQELDRLLEQALADRTPTGTIEKPGKTVKYGVGTVAVVRHSPRFLFFVAYTEMNAGNEALGTVDGVWRSLSSLWEAVSARGNGDAISVPVIGGGQARMSNLLPAQDSIRLIALSFMFASRKQKVCDELRIVVQPEDYERLDRMEIQSFLSSLRPS